MRIPRPFLVGETLAAALDRFRSYPRQTLMTMAGLAVGTAATILVITLGLTGRGYVLDQIEGVGSHLLWATYRGTVSSGVSRALADDIDDGDVEAASRRTDLFTGVTPLVILHGSVEVESRARSLTVLGTTPNYPVVRKNLRLLRGRFLDDDDLAMRAKVCVVSRRLYEKLFPEGGAGEKYVRSMSMRFAVIGEFEEPVDTLGQGDVTPETIFVPITVAWDFLPRHRVDTLFASVRDLSRVKSAASVLEDMLRQRHRPGSDYDVESMAAVLRVANAISIGLLAVFALVAAISVVVGGVGIMNILLASVEFRTREIGLRRSLGARQRDILGQFLVEAGLLAAIGAGLGAAVGVALPLAARGFVHGVTVRFSSLSAVGSFLFSLLVALAFGIAPAVRAARLDPVEALRHE